MRTVFLNFGGLLAIACLLILITLVLLHWPRRNPDITISRIQQVLEDLAIRPPKYKVHPDELAFPLAFSLQIYTEIDRAIRLLRTIYRPHNLYCIHVDRNAPVGYYTTMRNAVDRIGSNVFLLSDNERIAISWGGLSTLEADIKCALHLLRRNTTWKYWINLTGQEFPLRTNWELVTALSEMNGTNLVLGSLKPREPWRVPPPSLTSFHVIWSKGSAHVAVRIEFVRFIQTDPKAIELLEALRRWEYVSRRLIFADEFYFPTLNHNPSVFPIPGVYLGSGGSEMQNPLVQRHKIWQFDGRPCGSDHWQRQICIFGVADVPVLKSSVYLFANKFAADFEPEAYDELERWIQEKTEYEAAHGALHPTFQREIYSKFETTWNHL